MLFAVRCLLLPLVLLLLTEQVAAEKLRLTIGKEVYEVPVGEPFAVKIDGKRVTMRVDPQASREFAASEVGFTYPASMELEESNQDESVVIWTLQGKSAAVMLQRYASGITPESLAEVLLENIAEQYQGKRIKQSAVKLKGAERSYEGVQLKTVSEEVEVVQNLFAFENTEGVFALMVQDARSAGEGDSKEYSEALRLLGESLTTGKEPEPPAPELPATEAESAAALKAKQAAEKPKPKRQPQSSK